LDPVAANYFSVEYDEFVDSILGFCAGRNDVLNV
jgi:hypothetical protein